MTTFETKTRFETNYGHQNFLEIADKAAHGETGDSEFVALSRGYTDHAGNRRYKTTVILPTDPDVLQWLSDCIADLARRHARPGPATNAPTASDTDHLPQPARGA